MKYNIDSYLENSFSKKQEEKKAHAFSQGLKTLATIFLGCWRREYVCFFYKHNKQLKLCRDCVLAVVKKYKHALERGFNQKLKMHRK
jgi:hypothetical protein